MISTLQSSQVGAGVSMQIGEALDPINDAVERLSSVMVWAIGSLLLQRTALDVASSTVFNWGFVAIAVATISILMLSERQRLGDKPNASLGRYRGFVVRLFVVAAMVRFFVPAFVAISVLLSEAILQPKIDEHQQSLSALYADIFADEQQIVDGAENGGQDDDESGAPERPADDQATIFERFSSAASAATDSIRGFVSGLSMPTFPDIAVVRAKAGEMVENSTRLLVYIAIKNIVLPLVFLMIAVKGAVPITRRLIGLGTADRRESRALTTV